MSREDALRTKLVAATAVLVEDLVLIYRETLSYIVQRTVLEVQSKPKSLVKAPRKGKLATLRLEARDRFKMTLPDGRVWYATRARDLRRKARQHGIAFEEGGVAGGIDGRKNDPYRFNSPKERLW